jgi:hypothetical protein
MAQHAAAESLAALAGSELPTLFGQTSADVRMAIGKLAAPDRFARLAREFFARLTQRYLDYYLSRTLSDQVGPGRRLPSADDHVAFGTALEQHCREASRIVEAFAGGWFSKANFEGRLTPETARSFLFVALREDWPGTSQAEFTRCLTQSYCAVVLSLPFRIRRYSRWVEDRKYLSAYFSRNSSAHTPKLLRRSSRRFRFASDLI